MTSQFYEKLNIMYFYDFLFYSNVVIYAEMPFPYSFHCVASRAALYPDVACCQFSGEVVSPLGN